MNNSSHTSLYPSTNNSTSTLRPRAARLISYVEDNTTESSAISTSSASTPPRFPSRGVSPNLTVNRSKSADKSKHGRPTKYASVSLAGSQGPSPGNQGLWESWSSIQGIASSLLGNDASASSRDRPTSAFKTPLWMKQDKSYTPKTSALQWGPSHEPTNSTQGSIEQRKAKVETKKREALLLASAAGAQDKLGKYKRRDSDADESLGKSVGSDEDALVYIHKIQDGDTLAGVIIRYNCQAEIFRKINRFWPNDNIQTRSHVLVPLEACLARGRKTDSPYLSQDLFDPETSDAGAQHTSTRYENDHPITGNEHQSHFISQSTISSSLTSEPLSLITSLPEDVAFQHDSWVMLPSSKEPVEVLRVPRRALGYFPRARRKSNAALSAVSTESTPRTSFDTLRHPPTHAAQTSASLNASPVRRPALQNRINSGRQRSSSVTGSGNSFAEALRGPGGVGTLSGLRTEISRPGPAEDPLNKKFAQYLPDLLPPEDLPRTGFTSRPSFRATPRASTESVRSTRSNSSNLGDVGGAIEGWVRKMAGAKAVPKMGDLIELETNSEGVELGGGSRNGMMMNTNLVQARSSDNTPTPTAVRPDYNTCTSTATVTEQDLLNERFPIRGRVKNAYETGES